MRRHITTCLMFLPAALMLFSCTKSGMGNNSSGGVITASKLSYGDSIFYIKNQSSDYIVNPVNAVAGTYTAFPDGLIIDNSSGAINVSKSETGMKYRVSFVSSTGDSSTAYIIISGINFPDKYYYLASHDSIAFPVYNADPAKSLPPGSFDEGNVANNSGCSIKTNNGQINLPESIRNGIFGNNPQSNTRKDFEVKYRLNDNSGSALNSIKILIYYFDTKNDVPQDLLQTVVDHQIMTLQPNNTPVASGTIARAATKPRPPCIVIIAH